MIKGHIMTVGMPFRGWVIGNNSGDICSKAPAAMTIKKIIEAMIALRDEHQGIRSIRFSAQGPGHVATFRLSREPIAKRCVFKAVFSDKFRPDEEAL